MIAAVFMAVFMQLAYYPRSPFRRLATSCATAPFYLSFYFLGGLLLDPLLLVVLLMSFSLSINLSRKVDCYAG